MAAVIPDTVAAAPDTVAVAPDTDTTFTDKRDGKVYKIVKIGSQVWFAENLNYVTEGSKCYGEGGKIFIKTLIERDDNNKIKGIKDITKTLSDAEVQANCSKYGRLYTWDAAMKACPAGWHAPTFAEWYTLKEFVEDEYTADEGYTAGKKLKSTSGWDDWKGKSGNGMDEYGFSALPGGSTHGRDADGSIFPDIAGKRGNWWSATEIEYCIDDQGNCGWDYAKSRGMGYYGGSLTLSYTYKDEFMSVRCVLDDEKERRK
jgi:uncharacterized protein (TIGR02145 family)